MRLLFFFIISFQFTACVDQVKNNNPKSDRPNIVLFLVDDLGKEWLSCYGAEDIETPNIDNLAKNGILFDHVYAMPQCTPTRVTFLTGQYPFRHGWVNHWDVPRWGGGAHFDESQNPSLVRELQKSGYKTCIAGKWQIDDFRVEPDALTRNGFESYCMWTGYETGIPQSANRYQDPYLFTSEGAKSYDNEFGPDVFKNHILDFINENRKNPFFIYYPMVLTHTPFVNTPVAMAEDDLGKHKNMVKYVDKITGEIVSGLEEAGVKDNTIFIWTSDNGTTGRIEGKARGRLIKGGKSQTLESGINMPFIISWPKEIAGNQKSDALIDFTDLMPTFLDLAGMDIGQELIEEEKSYIIDGRSFKNILMNSNRRNERSWIMSMGGGNHARLTDQGVENQYNFRDRVLRNKRYKLYVDSNRKPEQFFDLQDDPYEEINLTDSLNNSDRLKNYNELFQVVSTFPVKDSDPRYIPNPKREWDVAVSAESQVWKL